MAGMDPMKFLKCEDWFEAIAMQAIAQRAGRARRQEQEYLAAMIASKVWEGF